MVTMATGSHQTVSPMPNRNHQSLWTGSGPSRPHAFDCRGRLLDFPSIHHHGRKDSGFRTALYDKNLLSKAGTV